MRKSFSILSLLLGLGIAISAAAGCSDSSGTTPDGTGATGDGDTGAGSSSSGESSGSTSGASSTGSSGNGSSGGPDGSTSSNGGPGDPPPVPYVDYDVNHVLFTGQSNAVANSGTPVASTSQPYANLMFDTGVMPMHNCDGEGCKTYSTPTSFVPLVEGDKFFGYPVETPASSIANEITFLAKGKYAGVPGLGAKHNVLVSLHGRSGNTYWCLRKGFCPYHAGQYLGPFEQGMKEVASAKAIAAGLNRSYVVRAVATIHGESDHYSYTLGTDEFPIDGSDGTPGKIKDYADALIEWQSDYESSVRAITGQTQPVPLFVSQISGWNDTDYSRVAQYMYDAHKRALGKVVLIGPTYQLTPATDCRHFTSEGNRIVGEQFAKVYGRVVIEGKRWEPLHPRTVTRSGATVTVAFHVPVPPLVLDTSRVAAAKDMGFQFKDEGGAGVPIANVAVTAPDTVTITLASAPPGTKGRLTYAQNQTPNTCIGTPNGARGNLRDSDATPSQQGFKLENWAIHFDVPVP